MATTIDTVTTPFLALPLELRLQIYQELLHPNTRAVEDENLEDILSLKITSSSISGYNRHSYCIEPAILQVNKQIHSEAFPVLYKNFNCEIHVFSSLNEHGIEVGHASQRYYRRRLDARNCCPRRCGRTELWEGSCRAGKIINLPCLWSTHQIRIDVERMNMFGQLDRSKTNYDLPEFVEFTQTAKIVLGILRHINDEPTPTGSVRKQLHLTMRGYGDPLETLVKESGLWTGTREQRSLLLRDPKMSNLYQGMTEMVGLLRSIRKNRSVLITEGLSDSYDGPNFVMQEVDLEAFPKGMRNPLSLWVGN